MRFALALVVAVIVYGSLFPFRFAAPEVPLAAVVAALLRPAAAHAGDMLANLLLYMPLGLLAGLLAVRSGGGVWRLLPAAAAGPLLSLGMEAAQAFVPPRDTSHLDLLLNSLGALLGVLGALLLAQWRPPRPRAGAGSLALYPALLLLAFVGWQLTPFVPTLDWQKIKDALKPLVYADGVDLFPLARDTMAWLAVGLLLRAVAPARPVVPSLAALAVAVTAGKVLVVFQAVTPPEVISPLAALIVWATPLHRRLRDAALAVVLAAVIVWGGLRGVDLSAPAQPFRWTPFHGMLFGSVLVAVEALFQKVFLYGTLAWLLVSWWRRPLAAGAVLGVMLAALEAAQTHALHRVAEVTDPLLGVLMVALAAALRARPVTGG